MLSDAAERDAEAYDHRHKPKGGATIHDHTVAGERS